MAYAGSAVALVGSLALSVCLFLLLTVLCEINDDGLTMTLEEAGFPACCGSGLGFYLLDHMCIILALKIEISFTTL